MNKNLVDITIVLDKSGSMDSLKNDTMGSFNSYFEQQKKELVKNSNQKINITFYQFSGYNSIIKLYEQQDINTIEPLTSRTYIPNGSTALLDCMARAIEETGHRLSLIKENE
jgi:hypothetical protein